MRREAQSGISQVGGVIEFLRSPHVVRQESIHIKRGRQLGDNRGEVREGVKAAPARKILIEAAHHVIQPRLVLAGVADAQIQQVAEQFPFVVVGNAAVGTIVVGVFLQPRFPACHLDTLEAARAVALQHLDGAGDARIKRVAIDKVRAQQGQLRVSIGDALAQPQIPRVIAVDVVHGFQRLGPDAFDVPGVEELVGRDTFQVAFVVANRGSRDGNGRSIAMFHAAGRPALARKMQDEGVTAGREGPASGWFLPP